MSSAERFRSICSAPRALHARTPFHRLTPLSSPGVWRQSRSDSLSSCCLHYRACLLLTRLTDCVLEPTQMAWVQVHNVMGGWLSAASAGLPAKHPGPTRVKCDFAHLCFSTRTCGFPLLPHAPYLTRLHGLRKHVLGLLQYIARPESVRRTRAAIAWRAGCTPHGTISSRTVSSRPIQE